MSDLTLGEKLKDKALEISERHLIVAVDDVYEIAALLAAESESAIDDTLVAGLGLLKDELKKLADKIAPKVDSI